MNRSGGAPSIGRAILRLALAVVVAYAGLGAGLAWWQVFEAQRLTDDPGNPLVLAASRSAPRGRILDAAGRVLARSVKADDGTMRREYPAPAAAPVVGYKSLLFGASGIERAYDGALLGLSQLTPADQLLRKFRPDPYDPQDVTLSIDLRLQTRAMRLLGDRHGAVVAIEPATGRVLALASTPTFDPARIADPAGGRAYFEELQKQPDESSPLINRATQGRYTPGSIFKIVTAVAGLGSGAISPETKYEEQPEEERTGFLVQGYRIRDGHHEFTGDTPLALAGAVENSCNIWFARAGLEIGGPTLVEWAARMGFGDSIPFELPTAGSAVSGGGDEPGGFRDRVELASAAFGQGRTFVTPLQMALVAATVANDGTLMKPRLVDAVGTGGGARRIGDEQWRRVLAPDDAGVIKAAMQDAVEGRFGRLFAGGAKVPGVPTAGKSGTAELGGEGEPHSWFIGFAPVDQPRIAVAVLVERAGFGREAAVPLAGDVMEYWLDLER
ncbi:MAG TPA: penicillin-binding protein 2 [Candidatus Limnocylindrales bacterium]|nr:penicillin-binding protein 2 [Candidatus Limnocylindrales bacterium]